MKELLKHIKYSGHDFDIFMQGMADAKSNKSAERRSLPWERSVFSRGWGRDLFVSFT